MISQWFEEKKITEGFDTVAIVSVWYCRFVTVVSDTVNLVNISVLFLGFTINCYIRSVFTYHYPKLFISPIKMFHLKCTLHIPPGYQLSELALVYPSSWSAYRALSIYLALTFNTLFVFLRPSHVIRTSKAVFSNYIICSIYSQPLS